MGIRNRRICRPSARQQGMIPLVDSLEPRRLFAATPAGAYAFGGAATASLTDSDGTVAKFSLPAGKGTVTVAEDGGWHVLVTQSTPAGSLSITTAGGDGGVTLAEFVATKPMASIDASKAKLSGSMTLANVKALTLGKATDLSVTSTTPLSSVTAVAWANNDGIADELKAPSVTSLKVSKNFAPDLTLSSKKVALNSATVGGTVSGTWAVAGSAGTVKLHAVRSPDLLIKGNVAQLTLDDYVAVSQVPSATGGVIRFGGNGSVTASKGQDKFKVAKNVTLYTCTAKMYNWSELYQYDHLGRKWTYSENGKKNVVQVAPTTSTANGQTVYTVSESGPDATTETYSIDSQGRGHFFYLNDKVGTFRFTDLTLSPAVYKLGATFRSSSKSSGHFSEDGLSANFSGSAAYATRFVGHELVKTPAGTFLAVKLVTTLAGSYSGSITDGSHSVSIKVSMNSTANEYLVPGIGAVKEDNYITGKFTAPSANHTETNTDVNHHILIKKPVDTVLT